MKKALVLSLAMVLGLGVASFAQEGTLSGSWDNLICFSVQSGSTLCCPTVESTLTVDYSICGWTFGSVTTIDASGWTVQKFTAGGSLGAFTLGSTVVFDPVAVAFTKWVVDGGLSLAGVTIDGTFTLVPNNTTLKLVAGGSAGCVDVSATINFGTPDNGLCDFNWNGILIDASFPFCCADVNAELAFNCAGFEYVTFEVDGIALPGLTWATLDAVLKFTTTEKTLVITPNFDFGATACFTIYMSNPAALFGDMTIDGIALNCEIGGVSFTGISYWGEGTKPGILKCTPYWEAYQISTDEDGCCGPFSFNVAVYFLDEGTQLFDVSALSAGFDIGLSDQFTMGLTIKTALEAAPATDCSDAVVVGSQFCLHFLVEW